MTRTGKSRLTTVLRLRLDAGHLAKLEELADFHGEGLEGTLHLLIQHGHRDLLRFVEDEFGAHGEKALPLGSQPDDEVPW